ncbi:hypothetical protein L1987_43990 [Smallanthus sonchifolius]|uniref:Uncharacterized protein n=1 Tax=Smallanthus sonchifolius TaxID=185202 RepID=A0ACB9GN76_9ASTR|nr:hypothetical protein L1987_43990 [Smallanthus sonchifolius]
MIGFLRVFCDLAVAEMGAKVQSKTYFPGSMTDVNKGFHNSVWDLYHDDRSHKIPAPGNSQHYDYFLTTQAMDGYGGYAKEQIRQTILKHESIFKHQLQELHRLYKRQKDLMNPVSLEPLKLGHFLNQVPSDVSKEMHVFPSFPLMNAFSPMDSVKGKSTLQEFNPVISKCGVFERRVIDLELPADVDASDKGKSFSMADLNEPIQVEERETAFSAFFSNKTKTDLLVEEPQKRESSAKRTLFGIEIGERNHTPSFVLPWRNTTSHHNNWLNSFGSTSQTPGFFDGNSRLTKKSRGQNEFVDFGFLNGTNSKGSVPDNLEDICAREKHRFLDMWKNHETPEQKLPPWLTSKPCLQTEQIKSKVHHINLDSLQNHSLQFFKKTENADSNNPRDCKKGKIDNTLSITKILGVPITDKKVGNHCESKDIKHHIDLNLSLDEEDGNPATPSFPESVVKIATMEIDLEAPAVLESDPDDGSTDNTHMELVKGAAEAIVSISFSQPPSGDTLIWFAEVITSNDFKKNKDFVPEGMDDFEYMTLKLEDTEDKYYDYNPIIVEEQKEDENGLLSKRTARKGQGKRGRQRKDFQKDILPSIVSLSRREVTEDLQIFEEALSATGVSWQSSSSKRKAAARNGRGRRRLVSAEPSCHPPPASGGGERTSCMEMSLEKSLEGWGRRTRRLPRQRCQNGGNHNQSLALKC